VIDLNKAFDNQNIMHTEPIEFVKQYMDTTVGRVIFNDNFPRRCRSLTACSRRRAWPSSCNIAI